jgi:hypothetical protein
MELEVEVTRTHGGGGDRSYRGRKGPDHMQVEDSVSVIPQDIPAASLTHAITS